MPSDKQKELFNKLVDEKQLPEGHTPEGLKSQFAAVPTESASAWIEKALSLPKKGEVPPPF